MEKLSSNIIENPKIINSLSLNEEKNEEKKLQKNLHFNNLNNKKHFNNQKLKNLKTSIPEKHNSSEFPNNLKSEAELKNIQAIISNKIISNNNNKNCNTLKLSQLNELDSLQKNQTFKYNNFEVVEKDKMSSHYSYNNKISNNEFLDIVNNQNKLNLDKNNKSKNIIITDKLSNKIMNNRNGNFISQHQFDFLNHANINNKVNNQLHVFNKTAINIPTPNINSIQNDFNIISHNSQPQIFSSNNHNINTPHNFNLINQNINNIVCPNPSKLAFNPEQNKLYEKPINSSSNFLHLLNKNYIESKQFSLAHIKIINAVYRNSIIPVVPEIFSKPLK